MNLSPDAYLLCQQSALIPFSGVAALFQQQQIALFYLPGQTPELYAISHWDPLSQAPVLAHGLVGETQGEFYVASPLHKEQYRLRDGQCLQHPALQLPVYAVQLDQGQVWLLPGAEAMSTLHRQCA